MRIPRRPAKSIQAIPSIYTSFQINYKALSSSSANESPESVIEDGIEVVPIERSNTTCGKIVSPGIEEKEIVSRVPLELFIAGKPLPSLPCLRKQRSLRRLWNRLPAKHRICILVGMQVVLLVSLIGGLLSIKGSPLDRYANSRIDIVYANFR